MVIWLKSIVAVVRIAPTVPSGLPASAKASEKKIVDTIDKPYYDQMHRRLQSSYARSMKKLRQSTVEPVLGTLINFLGMKRINTRDNKPGQQVHDHGRCGLQYQEAHEIQKAQSDKQGDRSNAGYA